ncbi:MAG: class I SAM-dependent methyltransferase [Pirellulales bacterium]
MIGCDTVKKSVIQNHYDWSTLFYRLLWGPHIHHGLWHADEPPLQAQQQLTETMAKLAGIHGGETVIDIGCGMGGSSILLANQFGCDVTGVTLSPIQRRWAQWASQLRLQKGRTKFLRADAEAIDFPDANADVVWSIECTEHLFDKPSFFEKCGRWLKPGGRLAICAWLCGDDESSPNTQRLVHEVCEGFFCPSLGTQADYRQWFEQAGLRNVTTEIWTDKVLKTWEICRDRVERTKVRWLAKMLGQDHVLFLDRFDAILEAYRTRAMEYGCFIAERPRGSQPS